jgi:adenosylcobinamide-phosphate synthase
MNRSRLIPSAYLFDQLAGDPEWFPHPVRLVGLAITRGEIAIRRHGQSPVFELCTGAALTIAIVAATYTVTRQMIRSAQLLSPHLGNAVELLLAWTCLAAANLQHEAETVEEALVAGNLPLARRRLSRIVGRDTGSLDASDVSRAVIETLAESASDGIVAPLFYLALGGVPLGVAYKAVNTLDSMIGHADTRYFYFGKFAARLDDCVNYMPSRITAAAITVAAGVTARSAAVTWFRDGGRHKSPNAGQPEAAMAGALRVCVGGDNTYAGEVVVGEDGRWKSTSKSLADVRRATRIVSIVTLLSVAAATALLVTVASRGSHGEAI